MNSIGEITCPICGHDRFKEIEKELFKCLKCGTEFPKDQFLKLVKNNHQQKAPVLPLAENNKVRVHFLHL